MFVALVFLDSEIRLVCPKCCLLPKPKLACKVSKSSLSGKIPDRLLKSLTIKTKAFKSAVMRKISRKICG